MCYGDRKEGVLGLVEQPELTLDTLKLKENPLIVVMESVEKPGNLGAVLRTCDGAGVDALLVCDEKTDIYNPNVIRASLGAVFSVPTVSCGNKEPWNSCVRKASGRLPLLFKPRNLFLIRICPAPVLLSWAANRTD